MAIDEDAELAAMAAVVQVVKDLDEATRARVLSYVSNRFGIPSAVTSGGRASATPASTGSGATAAFDDFPALFHAVEPSTEPDRLLLASYWMGTAEFGTGDVSALLEELGHAPTRVSHSMEALRTHRPALVMQVSKTGRSKVWRLTDAGRKRVESWLAGDSSPSAGRAHRGAKAGRADSPDSAGGAGKRRSTSVVPKVVPDLDLRRNGSMSFAEFAGGKKHTSNSQRELLAVYYLRNVLGLEAVGVDHVFTCFKDRQWRVPANPVNSLQFTASRYKWLITSDMANIGLTTIGTNYVEFDMAAAQAEA